MLFDILEGRSYYISKEKWLIEKQKNPRRYVGISSTIAQKYYKYIK